MAALTGMIKDKKPLEIIWNKYKGQVHLPFLVGCFRKPYDLPPLKKGVGGFETLNCS